MAFVTTHSGHTLYLPAMCPAHINADDICTALSRQAYFGGHTSRAYSVAEHSMLVADALLADQITPTPVMELCGLLHFAPWAYITRPADAQYEHMVGLAIARRYGLQSTATINDHKLRYAVARADATVRRALMPHADPLGYSEVPTLNTAPISTRQLSTDEVRDALLKRLTFAMAAMAISQHASEASND